MPRGAPGRRQVFRLCQLLTGGEGEPDGLGDAQHLAFRHRDESLEGVVELGVVKGEDVCSLGEAGGAVIQKFPVL